MNKEQKTSQTTEPAIAVDTVVSHRFITHQEKTDWGVSIHTIEESGKAYARTYWYDDDKTVVILEGLHVNEEARGNGIASQLLDLHLRIAKDNHASSQLKVKEGTWIHEWYKRRGYKDYVKDKEGNTIWLYMLP